jgi:hypothetical protein
LQTHKTFKQKDHIFKNTFFMAGSACVMTVMDEKTRTRIQLDCLYDMFRDRIEENVIYIVYTENEGKIDATIDQLMSIAACSLTGYHFEPSSNSTFKDTNSVDSGRQRAIANGSSSSKSRTSSPNSFVLIGNRQVANGLNKPHSNGLTSAGQSTKSSDSGGSEGGDDDDASDERLDIDERISKVQQSIEGLLAEKASCHDKASRYLNKKMYQVTSYYSELSGHCRRMIETKTRKLIDLLLLKSENANTIDLHGLNPIQAKLVVSELLSIRQDQLSIDKSGESNIDIITGWGKHTTKTGQHRIRPTIVALLKDKGYHFYHLNKGALRVTIRR